MDNVRKQTSSRTNLISISVATSNFRRSRTCCSVGATTVAMVAKGEFCCEMWGRIWYGSQHTARRSTEMLIHRRPTDTSLSRESGSGTKRKIPQTGVCCWQAGFQPQKQEGRRMYTVLYCTVQIRLCQRLISPSKAMEWILRVFQYANEVTVRSKTCSISRKYEEIYILHYYSIEKRLIFHRGSVPPPPPPMKGEGSTERKLSLPPCAQFMNSTLNYGES